MWSLLSLCGNCGFLLEISYTTPYMVVSPPRSGFYEWPTLQRLVLPIVDSTFFINVTSNTFAFIQGYNYITFIEVFVYCSKSPIPIYCQICSPPVLGMLNALISIISSFLQYTKLFVQVWVLMLYFYLVFHLHLFYWSGGGLGFNPLYHSIFKVVNPGVFYLIAQTPTLPFFSLVTYIFP